MINDKTIKTIWPVLVYHSLYAPLIIMIELGVHELDLGKNLADFNYVINRNICRPRKDFEVKAVFLSSNR